MTSRVRPLLLLLSIVLAACLLWVCGARWRSVFPPPRPPAVGSEATAAPAVEGGQAQGPVAPHLVLADKGRLYEERHFALDALLRREMQPVERQTVETLFADRTEHPTLRNNALLALLNQKTPPVEAGSRLLKEWQDPEQPLVWRDFCIQLMGEVYPYDLGKEQLRTLLAEVARKDSDRHGATALHALIRAGKSPGCEEMRDLARTVAREIAAQDPNDDRLMTAFQIFAELGDDSYLALARTVARDEKRPTRIRMTAIAAVARVGAEADRELLLALAEHPEARIKRCARLNLEQRNTRMEVAK